MRYTTVLQWNPHELNIDCLLSGVTLKDVHMSSLNPEFIDSILINCFLNIADFATENRHFCSFFYNLFMYATIWLLTTCNSFCCSWFK